MIPSRQTGEQSLVDANVRDSDQSMTWSLGRNHIKWDSQGRWCFTYTDGVGPSLADTDRAFAGIGNELQVEVTTKDPGQQVVISQGATEWCLLIDVTPEHVIMLKHEKDHDRSGIDESKIHDRPLITRDEVEVAIQDYVTGVKTPDWNRGRRTVL